MKIPKQLRSKNLWIVILIAILITQTVLMGLGWQRLSTLWRQTNDSQNGIASFPVKVYVQDALLGLYKNSGVIEPTTGRVYLPELRVYLPLNQLTRDLRYTYNPPETKDKLTQEVQFNTVNNIGRLMGSFDDIPCLQRVVTLIVDNQVETDQLRSGSTELADGRTLYFYKNQKSSCKNFWVTDLPEQIIDQLRLVKSY